MKKYKKWEMLEIISILIKANESIMKDKTSNVSLNIMNALVQNQEQAILLGTYLDTLEGTEPFVHCLEDYCENIYQMSVDFSDENVCRRLSEKIFKQLAELRDSIRHQIPDDKKEIVFLPYKASMWDSLESVWKAALEDESCETYVVPIPYFDKNADGTLGQIHYEGNEYPHDVPVISWEEYSFEEHRPNITYIHNPYDHCNYVTSIHPNFYARELKKYTDKLIYIPYFVAMNDKVEPHFCVLPGIMYADKVIVQSDVVRETYMDELHKIERENNCKDVFGNLEEKILALGSPKYDKVLATCHQDFQIPKQWRRIIERFDGTKKKVIIYNTSIQNILIYNEKMLTKIKESLETFEKYKDDIALLWRPHPLLQATLQSLRPELWNIYSAIVAKYRLAGWGIYDDSVNADRAIAISDAYYGDGGSLAELYKKVGKPILLQNVKLVINK